MISVRDLSPEDFDDVREIAGTYLSDLEVSVNRQLFSDACAPSGDATVGLGAAGEEGLVGFLVGTYVDRDDSLADHFHRPTPVSRDGASVVLQHLYLRPEYVGHGHGSDLLVAALRRAETRGVQAVYGEAWIRPGHPDAVPMLEAYGFECEFRDEDYWAHEAFVASTVPCPTHDEPYSECPCRGAVYVLNLD